MDLYHCAADSLGRFTRRCLSLSKFEFDFIYESSI